ncbi:MAG: Plug domain-containing protein [Halioglobus sp.]|nr:Plug domain-containing protein [Halioglobus sp.]
MKCNSDKKFVLPTAIMTVLVFSNCASAQLEEVIVSAQKVEQSLQDVPVAITAFNEGAIRDLGIESFNDLGEFVPNAHINEGVQGGQAVVSIRGVIGSTDTLSTAEPGVGLYMNGVYIS